LTLYLSYESTANTISVDDAYDSIISTNLKGSVFWMAPEVVHSVKGQGYSAKVDIWSLGCVVLEMWAGRRPWGDMEALAAMFQVRSDRRNVPRLILLILIVIHTMCSSRIPERLHLYLTTLLSHPWRTTF
jgi:serine/threonine protein kinase